MPGFLKRGLEGQKLACERLAIYRHITRGDPGLSPTVDYFSLLTDQGASLGDTPSDKSRLDFELLV